MTIQLRDKAQCQFDMIALGEIMLRLDPGEGRIRCATSIGDPVPDCINGFGNGGWYKFTPPSSGLMIVNTFGSDFDTGLAVYTGSCDSLTEVTCNDDTDGVTSQITIPVTGGMTSLHSGWRL